jgi:hypothetical protein
VNIPVKYKAPKNVSALRIPRFQPQRARQFLCVRLGLIATDVQDAELTHMVNLHLVQQPRFRLQTHEVDMAIHDCSDWRRNLRWTMISRPKNRTRKFAFFIV